MSVKKSINLPSKIKNSEQKLISRIVTFGAITAAMTAQSVFAGSFHGSGVGGLLFMSENVQPGERIGDVPDITTMPGVGTDTSAGVGALRVLIGENSYAYGLGNTTIGDFNIQSSDLKELTGTDSGLYKNVFSTVIGTLNSNESYADTTAGHSGEGNFIGGTANKVSGSNGTVVIGGGNTVKDAIVPRVNLNENPIIDFVNRTVSPGDAQDEFIREYQDLQLPATVVLGNGNDLKNAYFSQITGSGNKLTGDETASDPMMSIMVSGNRNEIEKSGNALISGNRNIVKDSVAAMVSGNDNTVADSRLSIVVGNDRKVNGAVNTVILGNNTTDTEEVTADNAVLLGTNAGVTVDGGVAIGAKSLADTAAGVQGWNAKGETSDASSWKSTGSAVSIGNTSEGITRQLTGVAAGSKDTDAVNVAQLKAVYDSMSSSLENAGTTLSVNGGTKDNIQGTEPKNLVITRTDSHYDVSLADNIKLGNTDNWVSLNGPEATLSLGSGDRTIRLDARSSSAAIGSVQINGTGGTIDGLSNKTWNPDSFTSGRAATEDQLSQVTQVQNNRYSQLQRDIAELDDNIRDTGAASAALAGLKPIQYDPQQPTQMMAAVGAYRGSYALSVGAAHYTSERLMWHAGVALNEHPMFNVGVTFKFGGSKKPEYSNIPERYQAGPISASYVMQKEIDSGLARENTELRKELAAVSAKLEAITAEFYEFKKQITGKN